MDKHESARCLLVVDAQLGFRESSYWGQAANPDVQENIRRLVDEFVSSGEPVVVVRHDSTNPKSPLHPSNLGNEVEPFLLGVAALNITKHVNSAFYGTPNLLDWLRSNHIAEIYLCGITTNFCCETTARMAGNLGFQVRFVIDATSAFDTKDLNGEVISGSEVMRHSASNLHGEFADVVTMAEALMMLSDATSSH
jgi:nicotinamidase-related amidase